MEFKLESPFEPCGDQPQAIKQLLTGFQKGHRQQILKGATGTGKTFTAANVVATLQKPTLVLAPNKTLAAQLYGEFKAFFPKNAVHYFVSYFDYYQPEAYKPQTDTYIEKDSNINEEIDRLRHASTVALLTRRDVLIVASVSCIYGLGDVASYATLAEELVVGERKMRDKFIRRLTDIRYQRNDLELKRGTFRLKGDVLDIYPAGEEAAYRIDFFDDEVERIREYDPLTQRLGASLKRLQIFPSSHYVTSSEKMEQAISSIKRELQDRSHYFRRHDFLLEEQRLNQRVSYDIEMLEETGFVKGIENYSRYLTSREAGEQPATLLDYFPDDYLFLIDESHLSIPQIRGMYAGDQSRKQTLVDYGFRLPSALDNRPLNFDEFLKHLQDVIYISATPGDWEIDRCPPPAKQVIRPTGVPDPQLEVRPTKGQIDDVLALIRQRVKRRQRVLITTLTKRMAENLNDYLKDLDISVQYLHSDIDSLERVDILHDLRAGVYDVLVGINLLREGLDLPEVSLVIILDADKEGFLRSARSLIQTIGRAARHQEALVVMYADSMTDSMKAAIAETNERRRKQLAYNRRHGITPTSIQKAVNLTLREGRPDSHKAAGRKKEFKKNIKTVDATELPKIRQQMEARMHQHAANLEFEQAAEIRDYLQLLDDSCSKT